MADQRYLDCAAVAARLNVAVRTVHDYRTTGRLPAPDVMLGKSPGWLPETIDAHVATLAHWAHAHRQVTS